MSETTVPAASAAPAGTVIGGVKILLRLEGLFAGKAGSSIPVDSAKIPQQDQLVLAPLAPNDFVLRESVPTLHPPEGVARAVR